MTTRDNGKKIKEIWLPGYGSAYGIGVKSGVHDDLELSVTHHGDRDEFWVSVKENGVEKELINTQMITSIVWENKP